MKTIMITGANTGIGFATAKSLVIEGHHVILACRNLQKATQAKAELDQLGLGKVDIISLDLNSLTQVNDVANQLLKQLDHLDVLINNAGMMTPTLESTEDGFEKQFGVNYLAPFLLTLKLLPLLKKSQQGRVIHLASMMHALGRIKPQQFRAEDVEKYNGVLSYGNSKLANLLFNSILAQQFQGSNLTSNALHPGGVDSEIYRELPKYQYLAMKLFLLPVSKPAKLITQMALDESWTNKNGQYVSLQTPAFKTKYAKDLNLAQQLFDQSTHLVQTYL